jgi:hypothetical protein
VKAIPGVSPGPTFQQALHWHSSRAAYGKSLEGEDPSARFHRQQIDRIKAAEDIGDAGAAASGQDPRTRHPTTR